MNRRIIVHILGQMMKAEAALLLLPALVGVIYKEQDLYAFLITAAGAAALGFLCDLIRPKTREIYSQEGFVIVALSWVLFSLIGAVPFVITGAIPNYVDAVFETVSGFTTTGASILPQVEGLPYSVLFWRSFTHWVGGMGILVFVMMIAPLGDSRSIHLMRAEVPGPVVGKVVPKMKNTSLILYGLYLALTVLEIIFLVCGDMPFFDAVVHTFGTAGTGGFGIKNASIGGYSAYSQWVITVFMALFGVNFNVYFLLAIRKVKGAFSCEELRWYLIIMLTSAAIITVNILPMYDTFGESVRHAAFQVSSIMTTTGFSTTDFDLWPQLSRTILLTLMFIGACSGSMGGGLKVSRIILMIRMGKAELRKLRHPRSVNQIRLEGKAMSQETVHGVGVYLILFCAIAVVTVLILSFDGYDFETNFSGMAACLNNIGPGLSKVGPTLNYSGYSAVSKIVLTLNMLFGRLEIYPILLLITPTIWKRRQ